MPINYKTDDFVCVIAGQGGVDAVLDVVGAAYFQQNLACLKKDGQLILLGFMGGAVAGQINLVDIAVKRLHITGSTMRGRNRQEKAAIAQSLRQHIWQPLAENAVAGPIIHRVFDFNDVVQAHQEMDSGTHIGKIALDFRGNHSFSE